MFVYLFITLLVHWPSGKYRIVHSVFLRQCSFSVCIIYQIIVISTNLLLTPSDWDIRLLTQNHKITAIVELFFRFDHSFENCRQWCGSKTGSKPKMHQPFRHPPIGSVLLPTCLVSLCYWVGQYKVVVAVIVV